MISYYLKHFSKDYSKSGKSKFGIACFHRRFLLTRRDIKGFLMEILCPILLCFFRLLVTNIASGKQYLDIWVIGKQVVLYGKTDSSINLGDYYYKNTENIPCKPVDAYASSGNNKNDIYNFVKKIFEKVKDKENNILHEVDMMDDKYEGIYGVYLMLKADISNNDYQFVELVNSMIKHGVANYTYFFLKKIIEKASPHSDLGLNYIIILYP